MAAYQGQWVAWLAWHAGACRLQPREQGRGWSDRQKRRRLPRVVNHSPFGMVEPFHIPTLASRVMQLNRQRLSSDWEQVYHQAVLVAETFVAPERFRGTTCKASGWPLVGQTQGVQRSRQDFSEPQPKPKPRWVRELKPGARTVLRGRHLPAARESCAAQRVPDCARTPEEREQREPVVG